MATMINLKYFDRKQTIAVITLCTIVYFAQLFLLAQPSLSMPNNAEIIQYLNPIHEKSYVNGKQDRLIKKKSFKTQDVEGLTAIANSDIGLFATLEPEKWQDTEYIDHLLANQAVSGIACLIPWRVIEAEEGNLNWRIIDGLLEHCARHDKQLILRISTCGMDIDDKQSIKEEAKSVTKEKGNPEISAHRSDTPDWVFDAGTKSIAYTGKDLHEHLMPIFWDGTYLAKWSNFVNELGKRYDKNSHFQSIGITGGGIKGGTNVIPEFTGNKEAYNALETKLRDTYGLNPRQLVNHWKYVADVFPKAFPTQHLNFDLDPPLPNRKGQDCLDEISDYLVYRFGERIYLTRQNVKNDKRGFDEYRLLLKFKNDTLCGYQFTSAIASDAVKPNLAKITKNAFDDGLSFAEIPSEFFDSKDAAIQQWLTQMRLHLGYQLVLEEIALPAKVATGKTLPVHIAFLNTGAASPKRMTRDMDKGVPSSFKIQLEFKDAQGRTKALLRRTPSVSTCNWLGEKLNVSDEDLIVPPIKPGKYNIHLEIIDDQSKQRLNYCRAPSGKPEQTGKDLLVGSIEILPATSR